jgi:selenocysteine lyase/cysteine desulfurase
MSLLRNDRIRELFPALEEWVYLNSAAVAPPPTVAVEAVKNQLADVSRNGSLHYTDWVATKERCRGLVSGMLNVRPNQIAFLRNTSDGFAAAASGITWRSGDNVVSFDGEFPANFYPWRSVRDQFGVELRLCREIDGRVDVDEMLGFIDSNTRVVTISAVQFASGFRADLERIGEAAKRVGALFAVDIIQAFGAMPLDLSGLQVDIAAGASHKWLCSPEGCGIFFLSERAMEVVAPTLIGWISVEHPWDFTDREQSYKEGALALESGTGPASLFYGLEQSLTLIRDTGLADIRDHLADLTDDLCERLSAKDYELVSSRIPAEKSQIVCVKHRGGIPSGQIAKDLEAKGIIVSPRGDRLRIAPHFFNNSDDIERLVGALD